MKFIRKCFALVLLIVCFTIIAAKKKVYKSMILRQKETNVPNFIR